MPYKHYTKVERNALQVMLGMGLDKGSIAVILGKHPSSVYREIGRNKDSACYCGDEAQEKAARRRVENRPLTKMGNQELMDEVMKMFKEDYSPDHISGRLKYLYPESPEKWVSHETVYQYLYIRMKDEKELKTHFRHPRHQRKARTGRKDGRGQLLGRISIDERPAIVDAKVRVGDWEGDTVESAGKKAYVATYVDKATKYLIAKRMSNKSSATLNSATVRAFKGIPQEMIKTITNDNGKEFAGHQELAEKLGCAIYFAHPYHSWERGLNEHTNGLLRQYLPKKKSFEHLTQRQLDKIVTKINNRPRKSLGYRTPAEVFAAHKFALQT